MDLTFEEQIKLRDIARKTTRARTIEEKWKENKKWISCSVYKSNTKMLIYQICTRSIR